MLKYFFGFDLLQKKPHNLASTLKKKALASTLKIKNYFIKNLTFNSL